MTDHETTIEELWHNLFRMHGYVEAALCQGVGGDARTTLLTNADRLMDASYARVKSALPVGSLRRLEPWPDFSAYPRPDAPPAVH